MTTVQSSFGSELLRLAAEAPDRPALTCEGETLTRHELVERVQALAAYFRDIGLTAGDVVTLGLPNSIELVEALWATWWIGATPQPVSHQLAAFERRAILELADPTLIVGLPDDEVGGRLHMSEAEIRAATAKPIDRLTCPEPRTSPIFKVVTSGGSTGRPKLIVSDEPADVERVRAFAPALALRDDSCVLVPGPMSHNAPLMATTLGFLTGSHVVIMRRFDAAETLRLVERHRVAWLYLVPTMMLRIWRLPEEERLRHDVSSLEIVYHMAAPCPQWLKRAWIDWLGPKSILELYGGTELQAMTTVTGVEWLERPGTVGKPVLGEIQARDSDGRALPPGETGELWMRRGAGQPAPYRYIGATARADADGWESLGDMGRFDDEGYLYLSDRRSDMILVGGTNVYPAEIEAALDDHPLVLSSCVIGIPHDDLGNVPHAIVELSAPVSDEALLAHLRERLAPYKVPSTIERVDGPLRDDAGKVRRSALRETRLPVAKQPAATRHKT